MQQMSTYPDKTSESITPEVRAQDLEAPGPGSLA